MIRTDSAIPECRERTFVIRGLWTGIVKIPIDIEQERRCQENLLANRGPLPVRTDYSLND